MIIETAQRWLQRWQTRRRRKHYSGWDNPATGSDLLAAMIAREHARRRKLP